MKRHREKDQPLRWFLDLGERADIRIARGGSEGDTPEQLAALAQAYLYSFQREPMVIALDRLQKAGGAHGKLASALRAVDCLRRGEHEQAKILLSSLQPLTGEIGAWATLKTIEVLERMGKVREAEDLLKRSSRSRSPELPLLRAFVEARLHFRSGRAREAVDVSEKAAGGAEMAPKPILGEFYRAWAIYLSLTGDIPQALLQHRAALDLFKSLGDRFMTTKEYLSLGQTYFEVGELDHADFFFRKAEELVEELHFIPLEALLCSRQGMLALVQGDLDTARKYFERDFALSRESPQRHSLAYSLRNLGKVLVRQSKVSEGIELLQKSVKVFESVKDPVNEQLSRLELASARLALHQGSATAEATRLLDMVDGFFSELSRPEMTALVQTVRSRILAAQGNPVWAKKEMEAASRVLAKSRGVDRLIEALASLADDLITKGDTEEAKHYLSNSYRLAVHENRPGSARQALERLGKIDESAVMELSATSPFPQEGIPDKEIERFGQFLLSTKSKAFSALLKEAEQVASTDETVLLEGDTGTGKEMLAHFIHSRSSRKGAPIQAVNCGAIPDTLVESEFFGHVRGAFTGAVETRVGVFEAANHGTVFLDEVGELSKRGQVTLLRFLQDRQVRPVGTASSRWADVRILAATNRDLADEVRGGNFRPDLFYRLAVFCLRVPSLRSRAEDIGSLCDFFLSQNPEAKRKGIEKVSSSVLELFKAYDWPGNLREMENVIRSSVIRCRGRQILRRDLPESFLLADQRPQRLPKLDEVIQQHVRHAMERTGGHKGRAAALLGVHRNTLAKLCRQSD